MAYKTDAPLRWGDEGPVKEPLTWETILRHQRRQNGGLAAGMGVSFLFFSLFGILLWRTGTAVPTAFRVTMAVLFGAGALVCLWQLVTTGYLLFCLATGRYTLQEEPLVNKQVGVQRGGRSMRRSEPHLLEFAGGRECPLPFGPVYPFSRLFSGENGRRVVETAELGTRFLTLSVGRVKRLQGAYNLEWFDYQD